MFGGLMLPAFFAQEQLSVPLVTGVVIDEQTQAPIPFASVSIISAVDSSLIGGGYSDAEGKFSVPVKAGEALVLRVDFLGYERKTASPVQFADFKSSQYNFGTLLLTPSALTLDAVEITGEKSFMVQSLDKRAYNVGQLATVQAGTAVDVLNNIPSVSVDFDGAVSLRGSQNVNILVNGKPSSLTRANLASLQASNIESIEIITNPSSKYDPDGTAGIINIVLKKNTEKGSGGSVTLGAGTRNKYNGGLQGFYRKGKINLFGNYNARYYPQFDYADSRRQLLDQSPVPTYTQYRDGNRTSRSQSFQGSVDYAFSPQNSLNFRGSLVKGLQVEDEITRYQTDIQGETTSLFYRKGHEDQYDLNIDANLGYRHDFGRKGHFLTADATYSYSADREEQAFSNLYFASTGNLYEPDAERQQFTNPTPNSNLTFQMDYTRPVGGEGTVEAGAKTIIRFIGNDYQAFKYEPSEGSFVTDPSISNNFVYRDEIHAAYFAYANKWKKFSYQGGVRAEQTFLNFELKTTNEQFHNEFLNFFPSAFLGYELPGNQQLLVNYSRRINRANSRNLNPFTEYQDPFNLRFGNPRLIQEYVNSFELNYLKTFKDFTLNGGVYYRQTNNAFTRIINIDSLGVSRTTTINLATNRNYGAELNLSGNLWQVWNFNLNGNVFRSEIDGGAVDSAFSNNAWIANFRLNQSVKLPEGFTFQVNANMGTPRNSPQGRYLSYNSVDTGIRKKLFDGKGDLYLSVSDIFNTQRFGLVADQPDFSQTYIRKRETRIGNLTFTYRFGDNDKAPKKNNEGRQGGGGGEDF